MPYTASAFRDSCAAKGRFLHGWAGRAMPAPPEVLAVVREISALEAARRALDRGEVVALDRVDGEHLVRGVAELVEGDRPPAPSMFVACTFDTTVWRVSSLHVPPCTALASAWMITFVAS